MNLLMADQAEGLRKQLKAPPLSNEKIGKTISFVSGKGGVGKSNTALNFSIELIRAGYDVLLMDLDIGMGNIEILIGQQTSYTIVDMLERQLSITEIIEEGPNGLHFLAGGSGLASIFTLDNTKMDYFLDQYAKIVQKYDYIVFDMGAGITAESIHFVLASDECIVVTTPEPTAIMDAYSMIKHIINNEDNMPIYIVMNQAENPKSGTKALERFKRIIFHFLDINVHMLGVLPQDKNVSLAVTRQIPYVLLNKKSAVARALKLLVVNYHTNQATTRRTKQADTFIGKLKRFVKR